MRQEFIKFLVDLFDENLSLKEHVSIWRTNAKSLILPKEERLIIEKMPYQLFTTQTHIPTSIMPT